MCRKRAVKWFGVSSVVLLIALGVLILKKGGLIDLSCITYSNFGILCPGCGGTRMLHSILKFDIYQAFRYNPFIIISIPFYVYMYVSCWKSYIKQGKIKDKLADMMLIYVIIMVLYGVLRNISWLSFLAPTRLG